MKGRMSSGKWEVDNGKQERNRDQGLAMNGPQRIGSFYMNQ